MDVPSPHWGVSLRRATKPPMNLVQEVTAPIVRENGTIFSAGSTLMWKRRVIGTFYQDQVAKVRDRGYGPREWRDSYTRGPAVHMLINGEVQLQGIALNRVLSLQTNLEMWQNHQKINWKEIKQLKKQWAKQHVISSSKSWERHPWRGTIARTPVISHESFRDKLEVLEREQLRAEHVVGVLEWESNHLPFIFDNQNTRSNLYQCGVKKCFCGNEVWFLTYDSYDLTSQHIPPHAVVQGGEAHDIYYIDLSDVSTGLSRLDGRIIEDPTRIDYDPKEYYKTWW